MARRTVTRKAVFRVAQELAKREDELRALAGKLPEQGRVVVHAQVDALAEARLLVEGLLTGEA